MTLPQSMQAMVLESPQAPLQQRQMPIPRPASEQVLLKVIACGICRTDLHIADGELTKPKLPLILGHEIIGEIISTGSAVSSLKQGDLVGVPWLGYTCGKCKYCREQKENLCSYAQFTGYTLDGGFAEYTVTDHRFCFLLTAALAKPVMAPLMCAGLIGYRSYRMIAPDARTIGLYGFGAAAHILIQVALFQGKKIYAFTKKKGDSPGELAKRLGTVWAGGSADLPPEKLDAAIIFAPVGELVPNALRAVDKGGAVICGGIHMSDIPSFPYDLLWEERRIQSVANLTRQDGQEFLPLAAKVPVKTEVQLFDLSEANHAMDQVRRGTLKAGAAVLVP